MAEERVYRLTILSSEKVRLFHRWSGLAEEANEYVTGHVISWEDITQQKVASTRSNRRAYSHRNVTLIPIGYNPAWSSR